MTVCQESGSRLLRWVTTGAAEFGQQYAAAAHQQGRRFAKLLR
jgi:hypothetical protein